jgi:hypothetical protein
LLLLLVGLASNQWVLWDQKGCLPVDWACFCSGLEHCAVVALFDVAVGDVVDREQLGSVLGRGLEESRQVLVEAYPAYLAVASILVVAQSLDTLQSRVELPWIDLVGERGDVRGTKAVSDLVEVVLDAASVSLSVFVMKYHHLNKFSNKDQKEGNGKIRMVT